MNCLAESANGGWVTTTVSLSFEAQRPLGFRISLERRDAATARLLSLVYGPVQIFRHQTKIAFGQRSRRCGLFV